MTSTPAGRDENAQHGLRKAPFQILTLVPSIELDCGRAADLHLHQDGDTAWVVLFDVTEQRDATRRLQQKAYDMTLLQEKEAELNRRLAEMNREIEASNDFLARIPRRSRTISRRRSTRAFSAGVIADDDVSRFGDRLEARGEINLGTDCGVFHAMHAAEIADVAEAGVDTHAHAERLFRARSTPFDIELG
jgi:hypothetical protein